MGERIPEWHPFRATIEGAAVAASHDLVSVRVKPERVYHIHNICIVNETSDPTKMILLIKGRGSEHILKEFATPGADVSKTFGGDFSFTEGDILTCRFTGCTVADILKMFVMGGFYDGPGQPVISQF